MWILSKHGFYAVAENRDDKSTVIVRARVRKDLERFVVLVPGGAKITYHHNYDYPYRIIIGKGPYVDAMVQIASNVDYDNFKSLITKLYGHARHMVYMTVWSALKKLEANPKRQDAYWDRQLSLLPEDYNSSSQTTYNSDTPPVPRRKGKKHKRGRDFFDDPNEGRPFRPIDVVARSYRDDAMVVHSDD